MIPSWVDSYIGIPYLNRGEGRDGTDCYGLVRLVLEEVFDRALPCYACQNADDIAEVKGIVKGQRAQWRQQSKPSEGAVILLTLAGEPVHMGVVLDDNYMLHTMRGHSAAVERFTSRKWAHRVEGFYNYEN